MQVYSFFFFLKKNSSEDPNIELFDAEPKVNVDSPLNNYAASLWSNQEGYFYLLSYHSFYASIFVFYTQF